MIRFPYIFCDFSEELTKISQCVFNRHWKPWFATQLSTEGSRMHSVATGAYRSLRTARYDPSAWKQLVRWNHWKSIGNAWICTDFSCFFEGSEWIWLRFDLIECSNPWFDIRNRIFARFGPLDSSVSFLIGQLNRRDLEQYFFLVKKKTNLIM